MSANIQLECPSCRRPCLVAQQTAPGTTASCPHCGGQFTVPDLWAPPPAGGPASAPGAAGEQPVVVATSTQEVLAAATEPLPPPAAGPAGGAAESVTEILDHRAAQGPSCGATGAPPVQRAAADGAAAGRYTERGIIGRGGMGEVVLCVDSHIRRQIALKRILPQAAEDPERRVRFVEEAQVTGQLEHPNIVPVHELDKSAGGAIYFTMKLVKGQSLAQILRAAKDRAGWHSLVDFLQIFLKVCDGVGFAHSRGVIHRDLKPANIMVGEYGEVLVMDWGIAKVLGRSRGAQQGSSTSPTSSGIHLRTESGDGVVSSRVERGEAMTQQGSALGTPGYMSPEQAEGRLELIDARSDIYSLGAILYEILTLERPIEGDTTLALLANTLRGKIVPPQERAPGREIPGELSAVAMRCLARNGADRYPSVTHLKRDISLFLEGRTKGAARQTFRQAFGNLLRANKALSAFIALAAGASIAAASVFIIHLKGQRDSARAAEQRATLAEEAAVAAQKHQRETALAANKAQAKLALRALEEGHIEEAAARANAAALMDDSPWGHYALGVIAFEKKQLAAAARHLETALGRDPTHEPSKTFLARVRATPDAPPK